MKDLERFTLGEYLRDPSRGVVTGKGNNVRIICVDAKNRYPIAGLIADNDGHEIVGTFCEDGRFYDGLSDERDLYFADKAGVRFDPNAFEPFDRVLVRNGGWDDWLPAIFGYQRPGLLGVVTAGGDRWTMCVPYNDETAGLPGTDDDCPEFYKWWED